MCISYYFLRGATRRAWLEGHYVVRAVFGVVVFQDRIQVCALVIPTLLGPPSLGRQSVFGEQRLLPRRQVARF